MNSDALSTYLNDHRAGSVGAVELLEHLVSEDGGHGPLVSILASIRESQATLADLCAVLDVSPNPVKRAGAWLGEKFARLRLGGDTKDVARLEALEVLALGIQGQIALWRSLGLVGSSEPRLSHIDFGGLEARAREQHDQVNASAWRRPGPP